MIYPPRLYSGEGLGERDFTYALSVSMITSQHLPRIRGRMNTNMYPKFKEKLIRCRNLRKNSTPQEIIIWSRLRAKRFKNLKFKRQYQIGKYIVDFICLDKKIIIELDGWQHKKENQERYDTERTKFLEENGFKVIRFWNNEINNNLEGVFLKIEEYL